MTTNILEKPLGEAIGERYLSYALSTIVSRSLPDVRDGLKPVHRRMLYAMRELGLRPEDPPKKCARIVGDVMGKYHPHGDAAIYDAMVRLAQDFNVRYPLVDGQGNFGNIDGDNAAAMRYTEARLTEVARAILEGIDEDAVDFRATYDNGGEEPVVMPGAFPNLLANGAAGIAVGMATSIPPHNVGEICDALRHLISHPNASIDKLVSLMPGPDFPTGGVMVEGRASVLEAYRTGRGSFRLRARWEVEEMARGAWQIVVTEIPWQVPKSRLIERIAELLSAKKLPLLDDVRDESADDVRLVLVPKSKAVEASVLMESLFRATELETRIPLNMNVLDKHAVPQVMDIRQVLQAFLDHRLEVLERRTRRRLSRIADRLELLGGYMIAYLNLDAVIRIIREEDEPKPKLCQKFKLTETQAEAILNMRLRSLRKLEEFEIKRENKALKDEQAGLNDLLADDKKRWTAIDGEVAVIKKQFGKETRNGRRRTLISEPPAALDVPVDAMIEREPVTVFCSDKGWIRAVKGHMEDASEVQYKEGDGARFVLHAETTDKLLLFGGNGKFYTIGVDKLPRGRGYGEPVRLMLDLENEAEIVTLFPSQQGRKLLVASSTGHGFIVPEDDVVAQTRSGKQILNLSDGARAVVCVPVTGTHVAAVGSNRKFLVFAASEIPEMARGRGVILQKYGDAKTELSDIAVFNLKDGVSWQSGERTRTEPAAKDWLAARGSIGKLPPNGFPRSNRFSG